MDSLLSKLLSLSDEELEREVDAALEASIGAGTVAEKAIASGLLSVLARIQRERTAALAHSLGEPTLGDLFREFDQFVANRPYLSEEEPT